MTVRSKVISILGSIPQFNRKEFCLTFHGVGNRFTNDINLDAAQEIIKYFYDRQYRFIITFDDAYESIDPLLMKIIDMNLTIKVFVPFGLIGKEINGNRVASEATLRKWSNLNSVQIHSHGYSHTNLTRLSLRDLNYEIERCRDFNSIYNNEVMEISYPRGKYNNEIIKIIKQNGFKYAWTTNRGILPTNWNGNLNLNYELPRIHVDNFVSLNQIKGELTKFANISDSILTKFKYLK